MTRRFRAPVSDGVILADPPFAQVPELVERNRQRLDAADLRIGGLRLGEFRRQARAEILGKVAGPLIVTGHQPELFHPGVWVKNFAVHGLAKQLGGVGLNLIADHDTMRTAVIHLPVWDEWRPDRMKLVGVPFDDPAPEQPWETWPILNPAVWQLFRNRVFEESKRWGYEPLLLLLPSIDGDTTWSEYFSRCRRHFEQAWFGRSVNHEMSVSKLSRTGIFEMFVQHIRTDLPRFQHAYNSAIRRYRQAYGIASRAHPAPELADGELAFWEVTAAGRRPATSDSPTSSLRPRALTLTLFVRLCLADYFIHGIGGGKYDEVTDDLFRNYFGIEPPAYQVLSATLHLPLPHFPATPADVARLHRLGRDLDWNPEQFVTNDLAARKIALRFRKPDGRSERKAWYRDIHDLTLQLRDFTAERRASAEVELHRATAEVAANAVLQRRDFPWVLYPEATLRPFLQQFLTVVA